MSGFSFPGMLAEMGVSAYSELTDYHHLHLLKKYRKGNNIKILC